MRRPATAWIRKRLPSPALWTGFFLNPGRVWSWGALLLLSLTLATTAACDILGPTAPDPEKPEAGDLKVLFIGASYLAVNDMPGIFRGLAEAAGKEVYVAGRIQSGFYLDYFANDGATTQAIRDKKWDYVVLSGGVPDGRIP